MAKSWSEVQSSPQYQALPPDQQNAAKEQYFAQVVAPQLTNKSDIDAAHAQFFGTSQTLPDMTVTPQTQESGLETLGRNALMQAREFGKGAVSLGGIVIDPLTQSVNWARHKLGFTDPRYDMPTVAGSYDAALNTAGIPNPQPRNAQEALAQRMAGGLGSVAGSAGVGALTQAAPGVVGNIGGSLTQNLGMQAKSALAGAAGSELARQAGAGTKGQIAAGLIGALTPAGMEATAQGAGNLTSRLLGTADANTQRLSNIAAQEGIPLKASQVSSSKVAKLIDSATGQVPFSGAPAFQEAQQKAFNQAVARTIGENADAITPQVFAAAKKRIGDSYNDLASRINPQITPGVQQKMVDVLNDAMAYGNEDSVKAVANVLKRVQSQLQNNQIPGQAYKSIDSQLGNIIKNGGEKGNYAGQLREIIRDAFTNSAGPNDQAQMALANQQYRDLKTLEPLVAKGAAQGGNISPAQLQGAVLANKSGKAAVAAGRRGALADLSQVGQRFLKDQIPDSGTPRRTAVIDALKAPGAVIGSALGTGAVFNPLTGLATAAGAVTISRQVQNLLKNPRLLQTVLQAPGTNPALRNALQAAIAPSAHQMVQQ